MLRNWTSSIVGGVWGCAACFFLKPTIYFFSNLVGKGGHPHGGSSVELVEFSDRNAWRIAAGIVVCFAPVLIILGWVVWRWLFPKKIVRLTSLFGDNDEQQP